MTRPKIFGIGLNKTGTTSLKQAFEQLGYRHLSRKPRLFKLWKRQQYDEIFDFIDDFETFEDWPWPLMVPQLATRFPDAKFVLTRRKSATIWVESLKRQSEQTNPDNNPRRAIYGHDYPHGHEADHIAFYEKHMMEVRSFFADAPERLLDVCWDDGEGWPELCNFLECPKPWGGFPHANKSSANEKRRTEFREENQRRIQQKLKKLEKI